MDLVPLAAHSRGYSRSLRPFFSQAWQLVAFSPTGLCGVRGNHEHPDTHVPCGNFSGGRRTRRRFHLHPRRRVPCGHFSGGRSSWWRFHLLVYAAKEDTMNLCEAAAKFKTDEEGAIYLPWLRVRSLAMCGRSRTWPLARGAEQRRSGIRVGYRYYFSDSDGLTIPCTSGVYFRHVQEDRAQPGMVLSGSVDIDPLARRSNSR